MDMTLVVLAAGIGARYGAGIKQLAAVGPNGEIIMDYSVHDAIRAGFDRVVIILRRDIYEEFRQVIGSRMEARCAALGVKLDYAFQDTDGLPAGRVKPWGTGQAVLCCKELLHGPFAVINADDYYGKSAFVEAYRFLRESDPARPGHYAMTGFVLKNTLSDAGGVTRGVCAVSADGYLTDIRETRNVIRTENGVAARTENGLEMLDPDGLVSMNMWMLTPDFLQTLETGYAAFRAGLKDPLKEEYLLPEIMGGLVREGRATLRVLPTSDQWFGVTYQEDIKLMADAFRALYDEGAYREDLFSDLEESA